MPIEGHACMTKEAKETTMPISENNHTTSEHDIEIEMHDRLANENVICLYEHQYWERELLYTILLLH